MELTGDSRVFITSATIISDDPDIADLLQRERSGSDFRYLILGLPAETTLRVELGFAELHHSRAGRRMFSVEANGRVVVANLDPAAAAGGPLRPVVRRFSVAARRGFLDLRFFAQRDTATVGYIRVRGPELDLLISPRAPESKPAGDFAPWDPATGIIRQDERHLAWLSGVPFGGLGTGKFEVLSNGWFANFTQGDSSDKPVRRRPRGTFFAVVAKTRSGRGTARLLRVHDPSAKRGDYAGSRSVPGAEYRGLFPFAEWRFLDDSVPLEVRLGGFSALVPGDAGNSSLPAAFFDVEVRNPNKIPVSTGVAFSWEDVNPAPGGPLRVEAGGSSVAGVRLGRVPQVATAVGFAPPPSADDAFVGVETSGVVVTQLLHWDPSSGSIPWWRNFEKTCRLEKRGQKVSGWSGRPESATASVVCASVNLAPGERRRIPFLVTWYHPDIQTARGGMPVTETRDYATSFASALGVAAHATVNRAWLRARTAEWHSQVADSTLPGWVKVRALNSLFPLVSNSVKLSGGRFGLLESPEDGGGRIGNIEYGLLANGFLWQMFPRLAAADLAAYAAGQQAGGRVPDYLGTLRADPFVPAFVPQSGRHLSAVIAFAAQAAVADNALPERAVAMSFLEPSRRAAAYLEANGKPTAATTATRVRETLPEPLLRAAGFKALQAVLGGAGDSRSSGSLAAAARALSGEASAGLSASRGLKGSVATALLGEWVCRQAGLAPLLGPDAAGEAARSLLARHEAPGWKIPAMVVAADGAPTSHPVALGYLETALGCAAMECGETTAALTMLHRLYQAVWDGTRDPWGQPLFFDPVTGQPTGWRSHMMALGAWNLVASVSGVRFDQPRRTLYFDPETCADGAGLVRVPVFHPAFHGRIDYSTAANTGTLTVLRTLEAPGGTEILKVSRGPRKPAGPLDSWPIVPPFRATVGAVMRFSLPPLADRAN